jgi:hypothetical protein
LPRDPIEASYDEAAWPVPGPPNPRQTLWCVTDERDGAEPFRLALENDGIAHEVFLINGSDTCSKVKSRALIERFYPNLPTREPLCHPEPRFSRRRTLFIVCRKQGAPARRRRRPRPLGKTKSFALKSEAQNDSARVGVLK